MMSRAWRHERISVIARFFSEVPAGLILQVEAQGSLFCLSVHMLNSGREL